MWSEASAWFERHRATLAVAGIPLAARLEPDGGLMCTYADGIIRLALPDPTQPGGQLRVALLAGLLGLEPEQVVWLFRTQLPRLVAHEIGHALRDEYGAAGSDLWTEERAAERLAWLLAHPHVPAATRRALLELIAPVALRLGGLAEGLGSYRLRERARELPELRGLSPVEPTSESHRDLSTFLRVSVAWAYFDLLLEPEDNLDDYRTDLLVAR